MDLWTQGTTADQHSDALRFTVASASPPRILAWLDRCFEVGKRCVEAADLCVAGDGAAAAVRALDLIFAAADFHVCSLKRLLCAV
jgi:hypothetical protein